MLVLGDEIKNAFHLDCHSMGELPVHIPLALEISVETKDPTARPGAASL